MNQEQYNAHYAECFRQASFRDKCIMWFMTYFGWTRLADYISKKAGDQ